MSLLYCFIFFFCSLKFQTYSLPVSYKLLLSYDSSSNFRSFEILFTFNKASAFFINYNYLLVRLHLIAVCFLAVLVPNSSFFPFHGHLFILPFFLLNFLLFKLYTHTHITLANWVLLWIVQLMETNVFFNILSFLFINFENGCEAWRTIILYLNV